MTSPDVLVYLGLGSNLGDSSAMIDRAAEALSQSSRIKLVNRSRYYQSKPVGPQDQPDYTNAVIAIRTSLDPIKLLAEIKQIEVEMGRVPSRRWGERLIDIDILLYEKDVIEQPDLVIPHKEMLNRVFVLMPLLDIDPSLLMPDGTSLQDHLNQLDISDIQVIPET